MLLNVLQGTGQPLRPRIVGHQCPQCHSTETLSLGHGSFPKGRSCFVSARYQGWVNAWCWPDLSTLAGREPNPLTLLFLWPCLASSVLLHCQPRAVLPGEPSWSHPGCFQPSHSLSGTSTWTYGAPALPSSPFPVLYTVASSYISCPTLWPCLFSVTGLCALFGLQFLSPGRGLSIPLLASPHLSGIIVLPWVLSTAWKWFCFCLFW